MKLKKWLLGLVTFAAMVVVCAVCAGAETYGDLEYSVLGDGTVEITDYNGSAKTIDIPKTIDGKSVTSIGGGAFAWCSSLTSITIPNSVTNIGIYAFRECTSLKSVTIPNSVTSIDKWAFDGCTNLTSVSIPESVTSIGWSAFGACRSLIAIDVAVDNKNYASMNGVLFNKDKTELLYYPCNKNDDIYTIPDSVTNIAEQAFNGCTSLKSVTIPNGVMSIDNYAFVYCRNITNITIPESVASIGDGAFSGCSSLTNITIPDSVTRIGSRAFEETALLDSQTTPVKYADLWVVDCESDVENVIIKNGTKGISDYSFYGCSSLIGITIPNGVTSIGEYAFSGCSSLTSIAIPNGVTEIGYRAFEGCRSLTSITTPNGLTSIDWYAFSGCTSLKSITIPNSVTSIGDSAFEDCSSLTSITIPNSVTEIGYSAFNGCTSLKTITILNSVTSICSNAFGYYFDNGYKKIDNFKIYCYSGTEGEKYAIDNGFDYVLLDKLPTLSKVTGAKLAGRAADALRINWSKNASADGYIVEMYQGNKWVRVAKITSNNTTTFRKAGLKAGTAYKFRVRAYVLYGDTPIYSEYSATVTARTNPSVIKGAKLGGRAADALRINWTKNASADGYIVEMYKGGKWVRVAKITNSNTTTFRKAGLKASTVYKFRVRAYKMSGKTALYGNYSATVTARTNPSIVKGVKIGGKAKDALRVNWAKNASAQGYIVEMYKGGKWVRVAKITNGNTTTFRKAGLKKSTTYKFRVCAYYMSGKTALYGNYGSVSGKTAAK